MPSIALVAPGAALGALAPLVAAYRDKGYEVRPHSIGETVPDLSQLTRLAADSDALLLVGSPRRAPQTVLPGPFIQNAAGRDIAAGWLPMVSEEKLQRFAETAAAIHRRPGTQQPIAVLSQWQSQYLRLADRIEKLLQQQAKPVFRWTSDLLLRETMLQGMRSGLAAAVYVGHGRPIGWVGYRGTRTHHFEEQSGEPVGALLSLCCRTASRKRTGLSFAEALPLSGAAGATLGSVTDTLHSNNTRWAVGICTALESGAANLAELLLKAFPTNSRAIRDYRILGDPLIPLHGSPNSVENAAAIPVHP